MSNGYEQVKLELNISKIKDLLNVVVVVDLQIQVFAFRGVSHLPLQLTSFVKRQGDITEQNKRILKNEGMDFNGYNFSIIN